MIGITIVPEIDPLDLILEALSILGYLFILFMVFYANKQNPIFKSKGFPVLVFGVVLGLIAAFMDFITEIIWIENNYEAFKFVMTIFQIGGLLLFSISLYLVFRFTEFMMGET